MFQKEELKNYGFLIIGSAILAFGLYHIHSFSGITEGGILGLTLFIHHWMNISPAISGFVLNCLCYVLGWRVLGKKFIWYSMISNVGFSLFYSIFESFDPLWPWMAEEPLLAAILGAMFVGVGVGLCVRVGGAPGGDDALSLAIFEMTHIDIQWIYLINDLVVLVLSFTYIPVERLVYSLLTVILSGQIIGLIQRYGKEKTV